ncbi:MAG: PP2C family protein-serine/threonine phosphatase [bacterium JZ-2024 1]
MRLPHPVLEYYGLSSRGKVRTQNEDSFGVRIPKTDLDWIRKGALFIVADGVGGRAGGARAARLAVEGIRDLYYKPGPGEKPHESLERAMRVTSRNIYYEGQKREEYAQMASTAVAVAIVRSDAYVAQIGDSRAYIFRRGVLVCITQDHNVFVENREDPSAPPRVVLTRALGTEGTPACDLLKVSLKPGDRLLLCTDGLTNEIREELIREVLRQTPQPRAAAQRLVRLAEEHGGKDNITVLIVRVRMLPS